MIVEAVGWSVLAGYVAYTFWLGPLMERDRENRAILQKQGEAAMQAQMQPNPYGIGAFPGLGQVLGGHPYSRGSAWAAKAEQEKLERARITPPQRLLEYHPEGKK